MIIVNVHRTGATAVTADQIREAAVRSWVVSEKSANRYGDVLIAVRQNRVIGIWKIDGWQRGGDGKLTFDVSAYADQSMIGEESPGRWSQGQANPVKLIDTDTRQPEASEVDVTAQGNRRVKLDGWTLVVYPDGRARVQAPDEKGLRLIVESAFPGPAGGNVTVRLIAN